MTLSLLFAVLLFAGADTSRVVSHSDTVRTEVPVPEAASIPSIPRWSAMVRFDYQQIKGPRPAWQAETVVVGRRFNRGAVVVEAGRVSRHGYGNGLLVVDTFADLWWKAYANVRVGIAPGAEAIAHTDLLIEVYQAFLKGWEIGGGARTLRFATSHVNLFSGSAGKYHGNWYFRGRLTLVPKEGTGIAIMLMARRYYDSSNTFFEMLLVRGSDPVFLERGLFLGRHTSWGGAVKLQRYFWERIGLSLGAKYTSDGALSRGGVMLGLMTRW